MRKVLCLFIASAFFLLSLMAQQDDKVALTINGKPIYKKELQNDFDERLVSEDNKKESIDSFLDPYILKRMILEEAQAQRIDTIGSYKREFNSYKYQLTNSYLKDTVSSKLVVEEILQRFEIEVELNHIYIPFSKDFLFSKDTLAFYQEAMDERALAMKEGFDKLEVRDAPNTFGVVFNPEIETGYLGWIRPFMFPLALDEIIYSLEVDEVTLPIRTETGYHVFQVISKRKAGGTPTIEQVMFNFPIIPATKQIRDSVYQVAIRTYDEIAVRGNFQEICDEFSLIFETGDRGCLLGEVRIGDKIPMNLIQAAYEMKEIGEVSEPILTDYGYHILRLKDKMELPTKEQQKQIVEEGLNSTQVFPGLVEKERNRMKAENNAKVNVTAYKKLVELADLYNPHEAAFVEHISNPKDILLTIDGAKEFTVADFATHITSTSWLYKTSPEDDEMAMSRVEVMGKLHLSLDILDNYLETFMYVNIVAYEKEMLEYRNPKYAKALKNVSEGLLYTTLMEKEIWKKSRTDSEGLQKTFLKNEQKYTLQKESFKGIKVYAKSQDVINEIEAGYANHEATVAELRKKYNSEGAVIQVSKGLWSEGEDEFVDAKIFKPTAKKGTHGFPYYTVVGKLISSPQDFMDVRFEVEKDYQKELEEEWKSYLEKKYTVTINKAVIKEIK